MPEKPAEDIHASVLADESVEFLNVRDDGVFVDATLGLGGHAEAILRSSDGTRVIGIDQDPEAIELATRRLSVLADRVRIVHANFSEIKKVLSSEGVTKVDGILADLGVSSLQLDKGDRGFSFRFDALLDMRMDPNSTDPTAAELLETLSETEIANIIYKYGEEKFSRRIAKWIVEKREAGAPIRTTLELAALVGRAVRKNPKDKIHPATRTFQALRI